jgi:cytochrome c553
MRIRKNGPLTLAVFLTLGVCGLIRGGQAKKPGADFPPEIPKVWEDEALRSWALPLKGLGEPPTYVSAEYYYRMPERKIYRSYPIYAPGKEPPGYMEWLKRQEPEVVFDPAKLKTESDWIKAGEIIFNSPGIAPGNNITTVDDFHDPTFYQAVNPPVAGDGTLPHFRYSVQRKGEVGVSLPMCAGCHSRVMTDGKVIAGAQGNSTVGARVSYGIRRLGKQQRSLFPDSSVPWMSPDPAERLKTLSFDEHLDVARDAQQPGVFARLGTSPLYPPKTPDLIGVRDRKYFDATGVTLHRDIRDLMRYAAVVTDVEPFNRYGKFRVGDPPAEPPNRPRLSDAQLYALALYIYSLKPPENPNKPSALSRRGEQVFQKQGCATCHTPPLYTNNKLTPVEGFTVPEDHKKKYDILPVSVGTDPRLALESRKGAGYYRVPSLRGVWYRGPFEHNGSVATLEDWFDPKRLSGDYVPTGFKGLGVKTRAVRGHEFGLNLSAEDKQALIAFLKTL